MIDEPPRRGLLSRLAWYAAFGFVGLSVVGMAVVAARAVFG